MTDWHSSAWMQTFTGKKYTPFEPHPDQIDIVDIAHALAMTCRFNGHSKWHYSVAQHSILVAEKAPAHLALRALLHDAPEAYVGDLVRPIKTDESMAAFKNIESMAEMAICTALDLPYPLMTPEIASLDHRILLDERDRVMTVPPDDWNIEGQPLGVEIDMWTPEYARERFLRAYDEYSKWDALLTSFDPNMHVSQLRAMAQRMRDAESELPLFTEV